MYLLTYLLGKDRLTSFKYDISMVDSTCNSLQKSVNVCLNFNWFDIMYLLKNLRKTGDPFKK